MTIEPRVSRKRFKHVAGLLLALGLTSAGAGAAGFPPAQSLPARAEWPDPLTMLDGTRVRTRREWEEKRRPELQALFQHYMYGAIPPKPDKIDFQVTAHDDFLGGRATLKLVTISFGDPDTPRIELLVVTPRQGRTPAPVFLTMNFGGNHTIMDDPRVPVSRGAKDKTVVRGTQAVSWPIEEIVDRGFAFASFTSGDVDPDRADAADGVYAWLARRQTGSAANALTRDRGTIAAWAWGFHRCVDYLATDPDIDSRRIAVVGHSRNGKTALLAAAFDERIGLVIPSQAGLGGTAPSRVPAALARVQANGRPTVETVDFINTTFPHWFNAEFKKFGAAPERLPFDQHLLIALCAPRPILLLNSTGDQWSNPAGQFEMLRAAEPAYRLTGGGRLAARRMPPVGRLVSSRLGYFLRTGGHSMGVADWRVFLTFAETQWGKPGR